MSINSNFNECTTLSHRLKILISLLCLALSLTCIPNIGCNSLRNRLAPRIQYVAPTPVSAVRLNGIGKISHLSISLNGSIIAVTSGASDPSIHVFTYPLYHPVRTLSGHSALTTAIRFVSNPHALVSAGNDGRVYVWDLTSLRVRELVNDYPEFVNAMDIGPGGNLLIYTNEQQSSIFMLDSIRKTKAEIRINHSLVEAIKISPDGKQVVVCTTSGYIALYNVRTKQLITSTNIATGAYDISFTPDGSKVLVASKSVFVLDSRDFSRPISFPCPDITSLAISVSSDGKLVAVGGGQVEPHTDIGVLVFDLDRQNLIARLPAYNGWPSFCFVPGTHTLLSTDSLGGRILSWDIDSFGSGS